MHDIKKALLIIGCIPLGFILFIVVWILIGTNAFFYLSLFSWIIGISILVVRKYFKKSV